MTSKEAFRIVRWAGVGFTHETFLEASELLLKDLEALDIIKKREINVQDITDTVNDYDLYVAYCEGKGYAKDYICTKKEFKLLREVLVDVK